MRLQLGYHSHHNTYDYLLHILLLFMQPSHTYNYYRNNYHMLIRRLSAKYGRQLSLRTASVLSPPLGLGPNSDTQTLKFDKRYYTPPISDGLVAKLQKECWDGYVSTGRGCHTLFELLDTDSNNTISWQEIRFFLENVRANINPNARKEDWKQHPIMILHTVNFKNG